MKVAAELKPVYDQLKKDGIRVYSYTHSRSTDDDEITSLYWHDGTRVMNIQPSTWRNSRYNRDCFQIGVSYYPSTKNGSGCGLSHEVHDAGTPASELLKFRNAPTWVSGITNYKNMEAYLKRETVLKFFEVTE